MAAYRKRGDKWQAQIRIKGAAPMNASFDTKRAAVEWATAEEAVIRAGKRGVFPERTLLQALERYEDEVSIKKRGAESEAKRLKAFKRDYPELVKKVFYRVTAADLAEWRDDRLKKVTAGSVLRDVNLLRNVWTVAAREWGWCPEPTPWRQIKIPDDNPARDALWTWRKVRLLLRRLGYKTGQRPDSVREDIAYMFLLALQTGLRQGEIHGLRASNIDLAKRVIRLEEHKTKEKVGVRLVPVPRRAGKVLRVLVDNAVDDKLFHLSQASVDTLFRKYRDQCLIGDLTFHDSRAAALTWLSRRTDPLTLARISGHSDLSMICKRYYRERPEDIAARI